MCMCVLAGWGGDTSSPMTEVILFSGTTGYPNWYACVPVRIPSRHVTEKSTLGVSIIRFFSVCQLAFFILSMSNCAPEPNEMSPTNVCFIHFTSATASRVFWFLAMSMWAFGRNTNWFERKCPIISFSNNIYFLEDFVTINNSRPGKINIRKGQSIDGSTNTLLLY